jgi:hypothetical protein
MGAMYMKGQCKLRDNKVLITVLNVAAKWLVLLLCIQEVTGSNLGQRPAILRFFMVSSDIPGMSR